MQPHAALHNNIKYIYLYSTLMNDMAEDKVHGASGLTDEDLEFFLSSREEAGDIPDHAASQNEPVSAVTCVEDEAAIARAISDCGQNSDMLHNPVFIQCYNQIAQGPGLDWPIERRVRFAIQTMNRMGALEINPESQHATPSHPDRQLPNIPEHPLSNGVPRESEQDDLAIFGYHHLDRHEIIGNLIIVGGVLGMTILAALATYLCITFNLPKVSAGVGTISLAAVIASVVRLAQKWHHRFTFRYRMIRLVACMTLIFSTAAWHVAKGAWQLICYIADTDISIITFGMSMFGLLSIISLLSHLKLCHTYDPRRARILGWVEALALTFAIGAFLFCVIHKP